MSEVAAGAIQSLLIVLALGAIEKARTLRARAASWHPVLLGSSFRRRHATALVSLSLVGDICAIILGLLRPGLGLGLAGLLVILYTVAAATRPGALYRRSHCGCLGGLLDGQGLSFLIARNTVLLAIAVYGSRIRTLTVWRLTSLGLTTITLVLLGIAVGAWFSRHRRTSFGSTDAHPSKEVPA